MNKREKKALKRCKTKKDYTTLICIIYGVFIGLLFYATILRQFGN